MFAFLQNLQLASPQKNIYFPDHNNIHLKAQLYISYFQFLASKKENKEVQVFFPSMEILALIISVVNFFFSSGGESLPKISFARSYKLLIMYFVMLLNKARCCAAVKYLIKKSSPLSNITSNR